METVLLNDEQKLMVNNIIRAAEVNIMLQTGIDVELAVELHKRATKDNIYVMMGIVAKALGMTMDDYFMSRQRPYTDLKCLACVFVRLHYPKTPLKELAEAVNLHDHTAVMYYQDRAKYYLQTNETVFVKKYEIVLKAITKWITEG